MKKKMKIVLFIGMVILQLAVPVSMIQDHQTTLKEGQPFKFKAAPVDPYDPFIGRYLSINIEERQVQVEDTSKYQAGRSVYVTLENDAQGYAKISGLSFDRPTNPSYFKTKIAYTEDPSVRSGKVYLQIPFDRYYMPEAQALVSEKELNTLFKENTNDVYVTVRMNKGNAVMEKVYISGRSIEDYLKEK